MPGKYDANHQFSRDVTLSVGALGASAFTPQIFTVPGVHPNYAYDIAAPVEFSAGVFPVETKCLSQNTLQVTFFNNTATGATHGSTVFRLTSR